MQRNSDKLVEILLDKSARPDERDDAAIDLGGFDDNQSYQALVKIASDPSELEILHWSCAESIGQIWKRRGNYDDEVFAKLTPAARSELRKLFP